MESFRLIEMDRVDDPLETTRDVEEELNVSHSTDVHHSKQIGKKAANAASEEDNRLDYVQYAFVKLFAITTNEYPNNAELSIPLFLDRQQSFLVMPITKIHARQIYDSRGNPTVEVDLYTDKGVL
ncbi:hypothetical protein DICVIV_10610 [Dictyocaulus viviparus]|uniref:Enolase N-terminal domain-containing protein n=1 Tax=Dictyocaulus viviparus TaxID=29172 RepID=A0A0D8XFJ7_DICVI|nr:hypothetical protein DICVIV_10610 [Dictyocaulus viviparus]